MRIEDEDLALFEQHAMRDIALECIARGLKPTNIRIELTAVEIAVSIEGAVRGEDWVHAALYSDFARVIDLDHKP
jgi:hypothetical protein